MIGQYGQVIIENKKTLMEEIKTMLPFTTIHLIGPSGSGKTSLVESLIHDKDLKIDEIKILRLQGVSSEDFRLPIVKETIKKDGSSEKVVELINMGVFQEILDNPDRRYLVFLDEILRANSEVAPLLFGILERRINGIPAENMMVIACSNFGGEYIQNFDFSDSALRRRQIFIEYTPSKDDIITFCKEHNYNKLLIEAMEKMAITDLISHDMTTKELEQDTQLGSWHLLNCRWKVKNITRYEDAIIDISIYGNYFMCENSKKSLLNSLTMLRQLEEIDIHQQIILNHGLNDGVIIYNKKGKKFEKNNRISELRIRTKEFIIQNTINGKSNYFADNFDDIMECFKDDMPLLISLLKDFKEKINKAGEKNPNEITKFENLKNEVFNKVIETSLTEGKYKEAAQKLVKLVTISA